MANIKRTEPRLMMIVRTPEGKLISMPVKKASDTVRKYDAYTKSLQGLYVPRSMARHLHQPDQVKKDKGS